MEVIEFIASNLGVIGTLGTVGSGAYERAIAGLAPGVAVTAMACPLLVPLAEEGWTDDDIARAVARRYLQALFERDPDIDTLVLGCTHYPLLRRVLADTAGALARGPVAVVDSAEAARRSAAEEFRIRGVADFRELVGEIDAAILATPTVTHRDIGLELLSSGVSLLVEKPIACNTADADELVALARRQGLVLQVGHVERFNPALASVAAEVRDPKFIEATRTSGYTFRSTDIGGRQGLGITLQNVSEATGENETVQVLTTQLRDGSLFYAIAVAPERQYNDYAGTFQRVVDSVRFLR